MRLDYALEAMTKDSDNTEEHRSLQVHMQRGMGKNYERLEFLGDSYLKMATSISLFCQNPDDDEYDYHVNRMCLAADVPLIESGTAGYDGQVELIKKGKTQCYECEPKPPQKTFPGCTIRNTPSEPIHCIVWAKHLFK